eukprot:scaffold3980_cov348-Prasinococcus_capsulatus_cf.AAC.8
MGTERGGAVATRAPLCTEACRPLLLCGRLSSATRAASPRPREPRGLRGSRAPARGLRASSRTPPAPGRRRLPGPTPKQPQRQGVSAALPSTAGSVVGAPPSRN